VRAEEIEAVGELLGDGSDATASIVEETHAAIAARTFGALGPAAEPVRVIHDGISKAVYAGVRGSLRAAAKHGSTLLAARADPAAEPLAAKPAGALAIGALNGLYGDHLTQTGNALALDMELRIDGRGVPATPDALAAAFPEATPRLVVFIHGLGETEVAWQGLPPRGDAERPEPYGPRLQRDLGFTPLYVQFNSGLRISHNGRAFAALLEQLVAAWPVQAEEIVLVGHSMGGLVARSACHYGDQGDERWAGLVRHVFCLGTPHLGADLEKGVHLLDWALALAPESRAFSAALRKRSVGIKDLRFGSVTDADWDGHDPDEFLRDRCQETPFLPGAHYYFVGASLAEPLGRVFGDLLVRSPSASGVGKARSVPFEIDNGHHATGLSHFGLLNDDGVYEQLRKWIKRGEREALPTAPN
jgi:pimeloyl-ACP methyl ester carboxylesterase